MKKTKYLCMVAAIAFVFCAGLTSCNKKPASAAAPSEEVVSETNYFPAIDRYLVSEFGSKYAQGEHSIPFHSIVGVDERNADDILVWGDYWVFNYNQVDDTLKTVSGGSHPGLMHIRQTDNGYEVTGFDAVADGSENLKTAKEIFGEKFDAFQAINGDEKRREQLRADVIAAYVKSHDLSATMYQDSGWPAVKLPHIE